MVTEAAPVTEETTPTPPADEALASTGAPESTPSTDVAPIPSPVAEGATPPSTEGAVKDAPQETPKPTLTAAEMERLVVEKHGGNIYAAIAAGDIAAADAPRLQDRVVERERERQAQQAEYERLSAAAEKGIPGLQDDVTEALSQTVQTLGYTFDPENPAHMALLKENLSEKFTKFEGILAPVFYAPLMRKLTATLFGPRFGEFAEVTPEQAARLDPEELIVENFKAQAKYVLANPVVETEAIKKLKAEHDEAMKLKEADHEAAYNQFMADHGFPLPGNEGGEASTGGTTEMTYAAYLKLTEPKKQQFNREHPDQFNAFMGIK